MLTEKEIEDIKARCYERPYGIFKDTSVFQKAEVSKLCDMALELIRTKQSAENAIDNEMASMAETHKAYADFMHKLGEGD